MKDSYIKLISEVDSALSLVRAYWIDAKDAPEKNKWRVRIDELLDERIRLMRSRDAV